MWNLQKADKNYMNTGYTNVDGLHVSGLYVWFTTLFIYLFDCLFNIFIVVAFLFSTRYALVSDEVSNNTIPIE